MLLRLRPVVGLRLTRLRLLRPVIRLRRICSRSLVRSRRSSRPVRWLVRGRVPRFIHRPPHSWCRRFSRRRLLHLRLRSWRIRRTQTCQVPPRDGLPRMRCHRLLLRCEGYRPRRRSHLSYHRAIRHSSGRRCQSVRRISMYSQNTIGSRRDNRAGTHRSPRNFPGINSYGHAAHGLSAGESLLRNRGDGTRNILVHIRDVVNDGRLVHDRGVVDTRHLRDIHCSVADVDAIHVATAYGIRGHVDFARA